MKTFVYDNSFEGLLTAVYDAYYCTTRPELIVPFREYEMNFLYEEVQITTDAIKFNKVSNAIRDKISRLALEYVYHAYLSEQPGVSMKIYDYIRLGFQIGKAITEQHASDITKRVHDASSKTTREAHLLTGLLRFKRVKGDIYYSSIKPDCNVLTLLAPHFQDRLSDQRWIIHDLKRGIAAVYDKSTWTLHTLYGKGTNDDAVDHQNDDNNTNVNSTAISDPRIYEAGNTSIDSNADFGTGESLTHGGNVEKRHATLLFNADSIKDADIDYENLWRLYHKHISIETKRNIKLQKQHMPLRYWHYLPEKKFM